MMFPVDQHVPALSEALASHGAAILVAEPGAGKTTRAPLLLRDAPWLMGRKIVMLEPRRLAARSAARFMAQTLGEEVGETVGYTVRLERKVSARTEIEVVTEGILTRRLQSDPELAGTGLLVFDEFHERSLDGDLGLALVLDVKRGLREDLRILIMSATLDDQRISAHLGNAPVIRASGRMFPVATHHLGKATRQTVAEDVAKAVQTALREQPGSILAFLPGEAEIRRCERLLAEASLPATATVHPLFGSLSFAEQDAAIRSPAPGERKIVLATTIAETSLTIEGIGVVVDAGFKRSPRFDPATGMTSLETVRVSLASADQRKGRAGRLAPGACYRLWPEAETRALKPHDEPEIFVSDLSPLALDLANWGISDPSALPFLDPPPKAAFAQAQDLLQQLDAIDAEHRITAMGKAMVKAPLHPRFAHMVVRAAELGAGRQAAKLAAFLSERDGAPRDASADVGTRQLMLRGPAAARVKQSTEQIIRSLNIKDDQSDVSEGVLLALAWPDRIAQQRGSARRYRFAGGGGGTLAEHDRTLSQHTYLAVALTDGASGDQRIYLAAPLSLAELEKHFASHIEAVEQAGWDSRSKSVLAVRQRKLGSLVLDERPIRDLSPEVIAEGLLQGIREQGLATLPWTEGSENFRARVDFLARQFPEEYWPDLSDAALAATMDDWLKPYLAGMTKLSHLERLDMHQVVSALVPHELRRRMDDLAPRSLTIPNGSEARIDYTGAGDPTVRVRLQEIFGMRVTPKIAAGRAHLRIELLSPAGRPVAVTQSMETFWTNAYPDVRADLRGRYPKHLWPEDPLTATAVQPRRLR
jgi:ATP-dependent helicase HrpB